MTDPIDLQAYREALEHERDLREISKDRANWDRAEYRVLGVLLAYGLSLWDASFLCLRVSLELLTEEMSLDEAKSYTANRLKIFHEIELR